MAASSRLHWPWHIFGSYKGKTAKARRSALQIELRHGFDLVIEQMSHVQGTHEQGFLILDRQALQRPAELLLDSFQAQ